MSHTCYQYVCIKSTKFNFNPMTTVRGVGHAKQATVLRNKDEKKKNYYGHMIIYFQSHL